MSSNDTPKSSISRPSASSTSNSETQSGSARKSEIAENSRTDQVSSHSHDNAQDSIGRVASVVNAGLEKLDQGCEVQGERRQRHRNSGGFLLPSVSVRDANPRPLKHILHETAGEVKGKRKAQDEDLAVPKNRTNGRRHRPKPSLGSSPLSTEVYNATPSRGQGDTSRSNPDAILPLPSRTPKPISSLRSTVSGDTASHGSQGQHPERDQMNALGHDTDPVQIVNLALNLSENRRRNFSGGRLSPLYPTSSRRIISSNQPSAGLSGSFPVTSTGGSLRQHLQDQRRRSRNISPRASRLQRQGFVPPIMPHSTNYTPQPPATTTFDVGLPDGMVFDPTEATLARAEKARLALELSYEYRRLLQYLPRIPVRPTSRSAPSKMTTKDNSEFDTLGQAYNPLQYIRNRRIRAREKKTLDAEADGWKDVDRVRNWVETVASEREAGISRVDNQYPLPPYDVLPPDLALLDQSSALSGSQPTGQSTNKSRILPGNWTTTPWDLLADAYWLCQDENMRRIEDSAGNKIFSSAFTLSAARPRSSQDSERGPRRPLETIHKNSSADNIQSVTAATQDSPKERGRPRKDMHELQPPMHSHNSSLDRKSRWPRNIIRSRSSSSSGHSPMDEMIGRGRSHRGRDGFDSIALKKQMNDILRREAEDDLLEKRDKRDKTEPASLKKASQIKTNGTVVQEGNRREELQGMTVENLEIPASRRISLNEEKNRHGRTSLDSVRSTPSIHGSSPKIAIDPAPPSDQPSSPKKTLPSLLGSLRPSRSKERHAIGQYDFASDLYPSTKVIGHGTAGPKHDDTLQSKVHIASKDGLLSPDAAVIAKNRVRHGDSNSVRNVRIVRDSDSKLRGFLKGGRIAELVGNEVSRVGDLFSRRDKDNTASPVSPTVSNSTTGDLDYDEDMSEIDSSPNAPLSRATTSNEDTATLSRKSTNVDGPKYHIDNLPSFRSPFGRGEHSADSKKGPPEQDHITRQLLEQRQRGRPQRFDRLAPPRIDMRNVSPSASPPMSRSQTIETDISQVNSRQSSSSRSDYRARSADRRLDEVLGVPGTIRGVPSPSALSKLESRQSHPSQRPNLEKGRQWSICDRGVSSVRGTVTKRDIAHVRALLLSSGVKANEIVRRAHTVSELPSSLLKGLQEISSGPIPSVPRREEHRLAARILVNNIELTNQKVRDTAELFSNTTVESLHRQIKAIDERVTRSLTPMVRAAADDADDFSAQLTTTHTLAVKQLNDAVDVILRRRRRRLRWLRRGGYVLLEWTLLGIMWWVWFIVVIIRLVRGILGGVITGIRWFFWL